MTDKKYLLVQKISYVIVGLVFITLVIDFFFADNLGFGRKRGFICFEGFVFVLFLIFEFLKWHLKKKANEK
ncbi:MAG: hypothetical protein PF489_02635 [Salinivirgaceae bacterium]|jgi:hypothetical protein|nr:hypothetical protein [Salinivirgaceae bacterium]